MSLDVRLAAIRRATVDLVAPLSAEDACVQSMPDASPAKWHLAHTAWFFETVVLETLIPRYQSSFANFRMLFNSYYNGIGPQFRRAQRGVLTRPTLADVLAYRETIDVALQRALNAGVPASIADLIELGIEHEQQHQELLLMDIKHLFSCNPLAPRYRAPRVPGAHTSAPLSWIKHNGGLREFGAEATGFAFDNERPRHRAFVAPFALANRVITNAEYCEFVDSGGYRAPQWWLADGWHGVQTEGWAHPEYWRRQDEKWSEFTLAGTVPLDPAAPVCHVNYYEADAYARWADARLPTEYEWELAAEPVAISGNFVESGCLHPHAADAVTDNSQALQLFGDVWEWTSSAYAPYPGFRPLCGAAAEYNGKFMSNQLVLRGGACVTPASHIRASYRNFFYPHQRWQFSGIRLARDCR
ncbi:MAG: ergothioneine biosynthesis protein EgtB [Gammaproteobacteria bacterium]|nr:ergothioneine biosynthesis protein EgtB [Gammaproteobacteria bacterium]